MSALSAVAAPSYLEALVEAHTSALTRFFSEQADAVTAFADEIARCILAGGTLLVCGNGGSACDAMHIAGELVGRYKAERRGFPAIALSADGGILTALGNDYGFEQIFARQVVAQGRKGDILLALSTSGSSPNIVAALKTARERGLSTALLTGTRGADQAAIADRLFVVPAEETARVQEVHITLLHALVELADRHLAGTGVAE